MGATLAAAGVLATLVAVLGAQSTAKRGVAVVEACLRSADLPPKIVARDTNFIGELRPRPVTLLQTGGQPVGALIAIYPSEKAAAKDFAYLDRKLPVLWHGNVLVVTLIIPQPGPSSRARIDTCAFGRSVKPTRGLLVARTPAS